MTIKDQHLSDAALIMRLVMSPATKPDEKYERDTAHFAGCNPCKARHDELRRCTAVLGAAVVWDQREITSAPRLDWLARVTSLVERLQEERAAADTVMPSVLKNPRESWRAKLAASGDFQTVGMIGALVGRAESMCSTAPDGALELASLAREIADEIRIDSYPFDAVVAARAHAWREYAYMLTYLGRFPDALRAVERAEELFRQMPAREFDLARTVVIRALIYRSIDRVPEAINLTRDAADTFLAHGERDRYVNTRMTEAAMLIRQSSFAEALAVCEPLERESSLHERAAYGVLLQNIGLALRELGHLDRARDYLKRAIVEHEKHNAIAETARTRWSYGLTLVAAGQLEEALDSLRETWRSYERLRLDGDAALVGLDVAEVLLLMGRHEEVPAICRALLDQFTRTGMTSRAVTALAYLREAAAHGKATPDLVRHVRDFLHGLPQHPTRPFVPPPLV